MRYILKEKHPKHQFSETSCIVSWTSLDAYLNDVDDVFPTLPHATKHARPQTKKMRTPDPAILERLSRYQTKFNQSEFVSTRQRTYDVAGGTLDVPLYLSGVPEHFAQITYQHGKDLKLVFSPEVHLSSDCEALYMRGAAILSLVSSLEQQGNRIEVWVGWDNSVGGEQYESRILVKKTNQRLNLVSLAAPFCDRAFLETCEYNMISYFLHTKGVGHNAGITLRGDITIDGRYDTMSNWDSEEKCLAWIETMKSNIATGKGKLQGK